MKTNKKTSTKPAVGVVSTYPPTNCGIAAYTKNLKSHSKNPNIVIIGSDKKDQSDFSANFRSLSLRKELKEIIKKTGIKLLHFQYTPSLYNKNILNINFIRALKQDIPTVCTIHEVYTEKSSVNPAARFILNKIQKSITRNSDAVVVHSKLQKKYLEERYDAGNIIHISHGVTDHKTKYKKKPGKKLLCYGIIRPNKGLESAIGCMEHLPDYSLTIAGYVHDLKYDRHIRSLIRKSGQDNINYIPGWTSEEEKKRYYANSDIVILLYKTMYGMSGVLSDAAGFERPVITSDQELLESAVRENRLGESTGITPSQMATAIENVRNNYASYEQPIRKFKAENSWTLTAEKHASLYEKIISERSVG